MSISNKSSTKGTVSRRGFVAGGAAAGVAASAAGVLGGLFGGPIATATAKTITSVAAKPHGSYPFFAYHCSLVHKAMGDKLTRIVADPNISAEETNKALRSTFCPCCDTQISASYPVVPWSEIGKAYG
ncbi:MAG: hypothetical protein WBC71_05600 [Salaquimonas sp.]